MYKTIIHNKYTAEITWRDGQVKISGISNINWSGSSNVREVIEEYQTFLTKIAEAVKEFETHCLLNVV